MTEEAHELEPRLRVSLTSFDECLRGNGCEMALSLALCTRKFVGSDSLRPGEEMVGKVVCWGLRHISGHEVLAAQDMGKGMYHDNVCDMNLFVKRGVSTD